MEATNKFTSFLGKSKEGIKKSAGFVKRKKAKIISLIGKLAVYVILICISFVFLYPFIRMLLTSFMSTKDIINPEVMWLPKSIKFSNYKIAWQVLTKYGQVHPLWDSFKYTTIFAVSQTVVSALTGYAFARYDFKFKKLLFVLILASFIVPSSVLLIPRTMMFKAFQQTKLGTAIGFKSVGTYWPIIIMTFLGQGFNSAILILIFYNFFKLIPKDLYEAGKMDGANPLQLFWHITIKLSLTSIVVVFLFSFVWNWNETDIIKIMIGSGNDTRMPAMLENFSSLFNGNAIKGASDERGGNGQVNIAESFKMAATLISILPLLVLYLIAQKSFIQGIENTGLTGE